MSKNRWWILLLLVDVVMAWATGIWAFFVAALLIGAGCLGEAWMERWEEQHP